MVKHTIDIKIEFPNEALLDEIRKMLPKLSADVIKIVADARSRRGADGEIDIAHKVEFAEDRPKDGDELFDLLRAKSGILYKAFENIQKVIRSVLTRYRKPNNVVH